MDERFNAIYFMDVLEHIAPEKEDVFISNIIQMLDKNGVMIVGIPSLEGQQYASEHNRAGHVNCKSGNDFASFLKKYFHNVFLFGANDEVIHTGFVKMAHYLIAVCCSKK